MLMIKISTSLVALLHIYFFILEMFMWTSPKAKKAFGLTSEFALQTKVMAANQGLYNGLLAAGLIVGIFSSHQETSIILFRYILSFIIIAGIYGGMTVNKKIFFVQAFPAILCLIILTLQI